MSSFTVWKVALKLTDVQEIEIPQNAELLYAREQHGSLCVWCKCDPSQPMTKRLIAVVGTGHPAPSGARYVGSGHLHDGRLVLHVFENGATS